MKRLSILGLILVLALAACLPSKGTPTSQGDQNTGGDNVDAIVAATFAAQTAAAQQQPATQEPVAQANVTATSNENANCRSGPGTMYDILAVFDKSSTATVIGRYDGSTGKWYKVELADGTQCWVGDSVVTITGDITTVSYLNAPPTPTAKPVPSWLGNWHTEWRAGNTVVPFNVSIVQASQGLVTFNFSYLFLTWYATGTPSADGMRLEGFAQMQGGILKINFVFVRSGNNADVFSGEFRDPANPDNDAAWCGSRNGAPMPSECRAQ